MDTLASGPSSGSISQLQRTGPRRWTGRPSARRLKAWLATGAALGALAGWLATTLNGPRWEALALLESPRPDGSEADEAWMSRLRTEARLLAARGSADAAADRLAEAENSRRRDWSISANVVEETGLVELRAEASDPRLAESYLGALIEVGLQRLEERRRAEAAASEDWFAGRGAELEAALQRSEAALLEAARAAAMIPFSPERRIAAEADLQRIEERLAEERTRLLDLRTRPASDLGPDSLENQDYRLVRADLAVDPRAALAQTELRTALLEQERRRRLELLAASAEASARYEVLESQAAADRGLYQSFLEARLKAARAALSPAPLLRVADPPAAGRRPLGTDPWLAAAAGLSGGLLLGLGAALLGGRLDETFRQPGELGVVLSMRELGAIPNAQCEPSGKNLTSATGAAAPADWRPEVAANRRGPSLLAESIRSVRTSLLMEGAAGMGGKVWAVTSPAASDGKTTVAANLALSLAELGRDVLLVDADLRRPRLHRIFGTGNRTGLSDLLRAEPAPKAAIEQAIVALDGHPRLSLLASGVAPHGGAGLLHSEALGSLLDQLRRRFDVVIVDTPPALAVSDARVLARHADGAVLVLRAGRTSAEQALQAEAVLRADGVKLLGAVLSSWDPRYSGRRAYAAYLNAPRAA